MAAQFLKGSEAATRWSLNLSVTYRQGLNTLQGCQRPPLPAPSSFPPRLQILRIDHVDRELVEGIIDDIIAHDT